MATPIKSVPILTGEIAEEFIRKADERERKHRQIIQEDKEKRIADIMRRSREFIPSWMK